MSEVARGNADYVHADVENLSDSQNWPRPKKKVTNPPEDGEKEQIVQNPDSTNEEE